MSRKFITGISLLFFLHFLIGCSTVNSVRSESTFDYSSLDTIEASKFQEVIVRTADRESHQVKIVRLERGNVVALPFPYWNVESLLIPLHEINSIELMKKKGNPGKASAYGFGLSFAIIGILAAANSQYDEDYQSGLAGSLAFGGAVGLVSLICSGIIRSSTKSSYDFTKMHDRKKVDAIRKIMGSQPKL